MPLLCLIYKMASNSSQSKDVSNPSQETCDQDTVPPQFDVVKEYPRRGPWKLYRLASSTSFTCNRCRQHKTAKLVATRHNKWHALWCNACYGLLLSKHSQSPQPQVPPSSQDVLIIHKSQLLESVLAHRLSTVMDAVLILVMEKGKL